VANFGAKRSTQRPGILGVLATLRLKRGPARNRILFTKAPISAEATLAVRALLIVLLFSAVIAVFWWDRAGLRDNVDDHVSLSDVIYFTMVTVTTVGYGDIVPVSERARLIDALFVTPVRIFVWMTFLGTAYQFLIQRVIEDLRMLRLQKQLQDHILVLGYGSGGTTAVAELVAQGIAPEDIVVIDHNEQRVRQAAAAGFSGRHTPLIFVGTRFGGATHNDDSVGHLVSRPRGLIDDLSVEHQGCGLAAIHIDGFRAAQLRHKLGHPGQSNSNGDSSLPPIRGGEVKILFVPANGRAWMQLFAQASLHFLGCPGAHEHGPCPEGMFDAGQVRFGGHGDGDRRAVREFGHRGHEIRTHHQ
jgi:voltage-gated potassium channel Kch